MVLLLPEISMFRELQLSEVIYIGSDLYVKDFIVYQDQFSQGGVAYFNNDGQLVSSGGTFSTLETSGLVPTIDETTGITSWTTTVDGGILMAKPSTRQGLIDYCLRQLVLQY